VTGPAPTADTSLVGSAARPGGPAP